MRLHIVFLAMALLLDRSSAQNETSSGGDNELSNKESDRLADPGPVFRPPDPVLPPPAALRPRLNPFNTMQPQVDTFDSFNVRRIPPVPLRGFFAFRSPQVGSDRVQGDELVNATSVNCSEDWTKCQQWYHHPRQISKRMAMASGVPRTRRPYDVPQIVNNGKEASNETETLEEPEECFELPIDIDDEDFDSITPFEMAFKHYNKLWAEAQEELGYLLEKEQTLDEPPEVVPERHILVRRVSKMYLQYVKVANKIVNCYEHIAHPQKRILLKKVVEASIGRVLELKHELTALESSEFLFLDYMLLSLRMMPRDMNIKIPEYFKEHSEETKELKSVVEHRLTASSEKEKMRNVVTEKMKFVKTAMVFIRMLQAHERTRQARETFREHQKRFVIRELNRRREARRDMQILISRQSAAVTIQRAWRIKMLRKSLKKEYVAEMTFLGMLPRARKKFLDEVEKDRLYVIKRNEEEYWKSRKAIKAEMRIYEVPRMMEELEDKIRSYFDGYFVLYGSYPEFPTDEEGGSIKMFETPVDLDADEKETTETEENKSEVTKDSRSQKDTQSEKSSKDTKSKDGKEKGSEPEKPEGYSLKPSKYVPDLISFQEEYKTVWYGKEPHYFDRFDYGMLKEEVLKEIDMEVHLIVDEKMRNELERLTVAFQRDSKKKAKKGKKGKGKKGKGKGKKGKGKKREKDLTPDRSPESLIEELISHGIITSYPKFSLSDFIGDYNYSGSAQHLIGDPQSDPMPCLGDVRRVVNEYCILPMGSQEIHSKGTFVKSILFAGPKGVGKKTLVYAICNEMGATMIDLSAENIQGKYPDKEGKQMLLHLILKVGRLCQPTVIFIRDAENYFYKKKPATCALSEPGRLKKDLPKLVKSLDNESRIIVCGTSVLPFDVDLKSLGDSYNKVICILKPDFNCRRTLWREMIIRNRGILTQKLDMSVLCNLSDGFTAATIEDCIKQTLTDRRIACQNKAPLSAIDFLEDLTKHVPVYEEEIEAYKQWLDKMPARKKRIALLQKEREEAEQEEDESEEENII